MTLPQNVICRSTSQINEEDLCFPKSRTWLKCLRADSSIWEVKQRIGSETKKRQTGKLGKVVQRYIVEFATAL